jgi:hypothetical protein
MAIHKIISTPLGKPKAFGAMQSPPVEPNETSQQTYAAHSNHTSQKTSHTSKFPKELGQFLRDIDGYTRSPILRESPKQKCPLARAFKFKPDLQLIKQICHHGN